MMSETPQSIEKDQIAKSVGNATVAMEDIVPQECAACSSDAHPAHSPCCSSPMHGKPLCCLHYCKYHYVEVNKCSPETHRAEVRDA